MKPTKSEIKTAVNNSGYLFEQKVAHYVENLEFFIETNRPFKEPDTGKSRETDIYANYTDWIEIDENADTTPLQMNLVIECNVVFFLKWNNLDYFKY